MEKKLVLNTMENNEGAVVTPEVNEGEGSPVVAEKQDGTEELDALKKQIEERDATIGSQKREIKDAKKAFDDAKKAFEPKETPEKTEQQSNEPDYAKIGYLNGEDIRHPDDQKIVFDEATRLKLPLTDVLQMEYIKSKLTAQKDERAAQDGMPKGSGRKGGPNKGEVEYYEAHPDEHPEDLELHNKVIDAKLKKINNSSMFSDVPFVG